MSGKFKFVMKNEKTGKYWCSDKYPQLCDSVWLASQFDSATQARSSLRALMSDKHKPQEFSSVKIELIEHPVEE